MPKSPLDAIVWEVGARFSSSDRVFAFERALCAKQNISSITDRALAAVVAGCHIGSAAVLLRQRTNERLDGTTERLHSNIIPITWNFLFPSASTAESRGGGGQTTCTHGAESCSILLKFTIIYLAENFVNINIIFQISVNFQLDSN